MGGEEFVWLMQDAPVQTAPIQRSQGVAAVLAANGLAELVLGPFSGGLMAMCRDAIVRALAN